MLNIIFYAVSLVALLSFPAFASESIQNWQTYGTSSDPFTIKYPNGWHATTDSKTGCVSLADSAGAALSILPFSLESRIQADQAASLFSAFLHSFAPTQTWSKPEIIGVNSMRSMYSDGNQKSVALFVFASGTVGTNGEFCVAKVPKDSASASATFAEMLNTLQLNHNSAMPKQLTGGSKELGGYSNSNYMSTGSGMAPQASFLPATPFRGYTTFVDPSEHSFSCQVPVGWKVEGGLTRASTIDARPWVKATSPDNLIVAFIGDGKIPPYSMPTATGTMLGYGVGAKYGGGEVRSYVPARRWVEQYMRSQLKPFISNIQVVEEHDHPDVAAVMNGTVGATKSEAASIKFTGMYQNIPAVGYYLASTKATVAYGAGMWWVTLVAGELGPADRAEGGLSVFLHMLQSFQMDPVWKGESVANAGRVSRNYTIQSQAVSNSIMNRYWSQQAANDASNSAYWGRQAAQDHAANNFSDYIRGQQTVQDPGTGSQYKVNYGPQYHWIDPGGNIAGTNYSAPGPEWRQLMNVP